MSAKISSMFKGGRDIKEKLIKAKSITVFKNEQDEDVMKIVHFGRYPGVHGRELAKFLEGVSIGCETMDVYLDIVQLAAITLGHFRMYLRNGLLLLPGTEVKNVAYVHVIRQKGIRLTVEVWDNIKGEVIYQGSDIHLLDWAKKLCKRTRRRIVRLCDKQERSTPAN